jgi:hypothetical protein
MLTPALLVTEPRFTLGSPSSWKFPTVVRSRRVIPVERRMNHCGTRRVSSLGALLRKVDPFPSIVRSARDRMKIDPSWA